MENISDNGKGTNEVLTENHTKPYSKESVRQNLSLRRLIKDRGYKSEYAFAKDLKITPNHLSLIIYYKRLPSLSLAKEICNKLGVNDTRTLFPDGDVFLPDIENDKRLSVNKIAEQEFNECMEEIGVNLKGVKNDK
ncbi:MAG: helix-turn-helix transcriptional regulator [Nanoarchaeota archaeon]